MVKKQKCQFAEQPHFYIWSAKDQIEIAPPPPKSQQNPLPGSREMMNMNGF